MYRNSTSKSWNEFGMNGRMFMQRIGSRILKSSSNDSTGQLGTFLANRRVFIMALLNGSTSSPSTVSPIDSQIRSGISVVAETGYPVMKELPLPIKKTVAARYSSGVDNLPNGL